MSAVKRLPARELDIRKKKKKLNNKRENIMIESEDANEMFYDIQSDKSDSNYGISEEENSEEDVNRIASKLRKTSINMNTSQDANNIDNDQKNKNKRKLVHIAEENSDEETEEKSNTLPCREIEQAKILDYILKGLKTQGSYSSLYICGMPGTGKTACVNKVIKDLLKKEENFEPVLINGLKVSNPNNTYKILYNKIFSDKKSANVTKCISQLDNYFKNRNSFNYSHKININNIPHTLLVIDEIDCLIGKKSALLYNIFNWTTYPQAKLIIISISNTFDLPEKMQPKVKSRMGNNILSFRPYQKDELLKILEVKVENIDIFSADVLRASAMKVAAINGDLRRVLQICRRAKEIWSNELNKENQVAIKHFKRACEELFDSKVVKLLKELKKYEKLVLIAILYSMKIRDSKCAYVQEVYKYHSFAIFMLEKDNKNALNFDEFKHVIFNLIKLKIINFSEVISDNFIANSVYVKFYTDEFTNSFDDNDPMKELINNFHIE